jgi:hypothetical protein
MTNRYSHNTGDYKCSLCDKKYARKFTLERHIVSIHGFSWDEYLRTIRDNVTRETDIITHNTEDKQVISTHNTYDHTQNTSVTQNTENVTHTCTKCNKKFSRQWNLNRHKDICKGIIDRFACEYCFKKFKHKDSRCKHLKICKTKKEVDAKSLTAASKDTSDNVVSQQIADTINNTNTNIQTQNNIEHQNVQNNITVFAFPKDGDNDFEFDIEHISEQFMNKLLNKVQHPQCKFNNFFDKIMHNPRNRVIKKSNPNTSYSKIHQGEDNWEYGYDKDIYKTLTHHTTVAALNKIDDTKKNSKAREYYYNLKNFENYVTEVNEMDYDSSEYNDILQRIKLIVVNLTRKWEELDIQ